MEMWEQAGMHAKLTLAIGVVPLIMAIIYVIHPTERNLGLMRPISLAGLFAALSGGVMGFVTILRGIGGTPELTTASYRAIAMGASEALVTTFVGFTCLSVAWLLVAVGMSRSRAEA
jgi:hypothetical protein